MADDASLGEVMRTLAATSTRLDQLAARLDRMAEEMDRKYIPREVYLANHGALGRRVDNLERDFEAKEKTDADSRRQLLFIILGAVVTAVLSLIVAVLLSSGGPLS